jgi:hypothetical protein
MLSPSVPASLPSHRRGNHRLARRRGDLAGQSVFDIPPQCSIERQFGRLGTSRRAIGMPLRSYRAILQAVACGSRHCVAVRARSSTRIAQVAARSRESPGVGRARARFVRAPPVTSSAPLARAPTGQAAMVACLRTPETIWHQLRVITQLVVPRPRSSNLLRLPARTVVAGIGAEQEADLATSSSHARQYPIAAFLPPSQPPMARCCDDGLNSPNTRVKSTDVR